MWIEARTVYLIAFSGLVSILNAQIAETPPKVEMKQKEEAIEEVAIADYASDFEEKTPEQLPNNSRSFPPNFKEGYTADVFDYDRKVEVRKPKTQQEVKPINLSGLAPIMEIIGYALIALVFIVLIYYLIQTAGTYNFKSRKKRQKKTKESDKVITEEDEDVHANDYPWLIQQAIAQADYRRAVRYYFLYTLQRLDEKKWIEWQKNKTNAQYAFELNAKPFKKDFVLISRWFNFVWYGNFSLNEEQFKDIENQFKMSLNQLS